MKFLAIITLFVSMAQAGVVIEKEDGIHYSGRVSKGDVERMMEYIYPGATIILNSDGGHAMEGVSLRNLFWDYQVNVVAERCKSACAIAALGAVTIEGQLDFHMPYLPKDIKLTKANKDYLSWVRERYVDVMATRIQMKDIEFINENSSPRKFVSFVFADGYYFYYSGVN